MEFYPDAGLLAGARYSVLTSPPPSAIRALLAFLHLILSSPSPGLSEKIADVAVGAVFFREADPTVRALAALVLYLLKARGLKTGPTAAVAKLLPKAAAERTLAEAMRAGGAPAVEGWAFDTADPAEGVLLLEGGLTEGKASARALEKLAVGAKEGAARGG